MMTVFYSLTIALQFYGDLLAAEKARTFKTDGDILIGGQFPLHLGTPKFLCQTFNTNPGFQYMVAMLYALDKINSDPTILPGIKLGSVISDTCGNMILSGLKAREFVKTSFEPKTTNFSQPIAVVGPMMERSTQLVANILKVFSIPQISYGAIFEELRDKDNFNYPFRTVASNEFLFTAIAAFLRRMGWRYISLVHYDKFLPPYIAEKFVMKLRHSGICVGPQQSLSRVTTVDVLDRFIDELITGDREPKIVLLVTTTELSRVMLAAKKRNPRGNELTFVAEVTWGKRNAIIQGFEEVAKGSFTFGYQAGHIPEFEKYFHALRYDNDTRNTRHWVEEYWQEAHRCNIPGLGIHNNFTKNCTGEEDNTIYKEFAPVQVVINAVYAIANALNDLQKYLCPNSTGICKKMRPISTKMLLEFLRNTTFKDALSGKTMSFNTLQEVDAGSYAIYNYQGAPMNGSFGYVKVGSWWGHRLPNHRITEKLILDESVIQKAHANTVKLLSKCWPRCGHGQIRVLSMRQNPCCWDCHDCAENEAIVNNTCYACAPGFTPRKNRTACLKRDLIYINMNTALAIVLSTFSALGIITDLIFLTAFLVNRNHPLIKASGREMCYIIFAGIAAVFITPLISLVKPIQVLCSVRRISTGISFTVCYAPLLMKVWRIHGIFRNSNQLRRLSSGGIFGIRPTLGVTFIIIVLNILYGASISRIDPSDVIEKFYQERQELVLECRTNSIVFISIFAYNMMLLLGCTVYAFRTRKFPKNFNEAKHTGITLYLTCVVWVVFLASFYNSDYSISRAYWLSGSSVLIGWITLLGLFAPKFYHVYTKPEVGRDVLITWSEASSGGEARGEWCEECKRRADGLGKNRNDDERIRAFENKPSVEKGFIRNDLETSTYVHEISINNFVDTHL